MSSKILEIARRIHHNIETALWAVLFAFVVYFIIFVLPKMPEFKRKERELRRQKLAPKMHHFARSYISNEELTTTISACLMLESFDGRSESVSLMTSIGSNRTVGETGQRDHRTSLFHWSNEGQSQFRCR